MNAPYGIDPRTLSRRRLLAAAGAVGAAELLGAGPSAAARTGSPPAAPAPLSFTAATNGAASLSPGGDRLIAEIHNVLWSVPASGGDAVPLTAAALEANRPVHSPDGASVAFCAFGSGTYHIWTVRPDGTGLRQRTEGPFDHRGPAWSPDGTRLAFASERAGDAVGGAPYRIHVLELASGAVTRMTGRAGQDGPLQGGAWEDFDPTWSPDGERILFVRATVAAAATGPRADARTIASVPADGSGPVTVAFTEQEPAAQLLAPAVAPDGRRTAWLRTTPPPNASCVLVVDGRPVPVTGDVAAQPPRWTAAGELLVTVDGRFTLVRPQQPHALRTIPFRARVAADRPRYRTKQYDVGGESRVRPVRGIHLPALSPDGRYVAFAALNTLWLGSTSGGRPPRRLRRAAPTRYLLAPSWAPDGRSLLYCEDRDGLMAVHRRDLATGAESTVATGGRVFPALSPDGRRLACLDLVGRLLVRDLAGGTERVLAAPLGGGGLPGRPSWSPDGSRIALCDRNRLNMRFREGYNLIRVVDAASGSDRLHPVAPHASVADRYDSGPVWSPDGRFMAVIVESALCLLPVAPDGSPRGALRTLTAEPADHPSWSGDSKTLLYLSGTRLRLIGVDGGSPRTVRLPLDQRRPTPPDTVVHAGRLWDGTGETVREDVDVLVRSGRIAAVEPHRASRLSAPGGARYVDASARTVVPGLWDTHTHPWQSTYAGRQSVGQLTYGITTAVSLGGFAYEQARIREAVASGQLAGPRLLTSGELLDGARVAYSMGRAHRTAEGLRRSLERGAALDWDFVKTYVRAPFWVMEEAARFAHDRLGVRCGSHLASLAMPSGQDLTTHLQATERAEAGHVLTASGCSHQDVSEIYGGGDGRLAMIATPFAATALLGADPDLADDRRVTAVMAPWDADLVRRSAAAAPTAAQLATLRRETDIYRRLLAAGGLVALGTDAPLVPVGLSLHLGLRALHQGGLSPAEALRTVTVLPARLFGLGDELGTVRPGRIADLTIVDGDPFTDFDTLVRTSGVLRGGVPHTTDELVAACAPSTEAPATGTPAAGGPAHRQAEPVDWLGERHLMLRDGCCHATG
ncbi:amidohydrolase family protein [Streptomyces sp. NPDC058290]|uniref:amidohydrolase family protein n=1 Tax=Streptomyces sp. NPDC058290 TaxID=3346426 RepID=UPI0036E11B53